MAGRCVSDRAALAIRIWTRLPWALSQVPPEAEAMAGVFGV